MEGDPSLMRRVHTIGTDSRPHFTRRRHSGSKEIVEVVSTEICWLEAVKRDRASLAGQP